MLKEKYLTKATIEVKCNEILAQAHLYNQRLCQFKISSGSALIVLDMQKYFLDEKSLAFVSSSEAIIERIKKLINKFKHRNLPVIFTRHWNNEVNAGQMKFHWQRLIDKKNLLFGISESFRTDNEIIIDKTQYDAFYKTPLKKILKEKNCHTLLICGVMTNLCCDSTVRSAFIKGFTPIFPVDTTAAYNMELHKASYITLSQGFITPCISEEIL
ncbi:MAG: isochorismatase hydrolase [Ignavibacteria bacterium]|nr:isochorismatase hydrolase [Ignavibacteria bacterium]